MSYGAALQKEITPTAIQFHNPLQYTVKRHNRESYDVDNITAFPSVIAITGHNRTWSITLRYGTYQYGRLQIKSLEVEALIKNTIFKNPNTHRQNPETGKHHDFLVLTHRWNMNSVLENNNHPTDRSPKYYMNHRCTTQTKR